MKKNLSKVLTLILALAMVLGVMTMGASAAFTDDEQIEYDEAVALLSGLGVINGYPDGSYAPKANFDRAGLAKMVAFYAWAGKDMSRYYQGTSVFADLDGYAWAAGSINYGYGAKYIAGAGVNADGKAIYNPAGTVKGSELAKTLLCLLGYNPKSTNAMYTLEGSNWELNTIRIAQKEGLFANLAADFDPTAALTREEAAQIFMNISDHVVYTNYNDDGSPKADAADETALVTYFNATSASDTDVYGRDTTVYSIAGKPVATIAAKADYVYVCSGPNTTVGKVLEAYNKANGTKFDTTEDGDIYAGEVFEFYFDGSSYSYIGYDYEAYEVTSVTAAPAGSEYAYDIVLDGDYGQWDLTDKDLGCTVAKGDVVVVPYSYHEDDEIWADAAVVGGKDAKVSAFAADGVYVVTNAGKYYFDCCYEELDDATMEIGGEYKLYLSPVGTLIATKEVQPPVESYTTSFAYALAWQAKAYQEAGTGDLLTSGSAAEAAKVVYQVVGMDGKVSLLNIAVKYDAEEDNYFYTGTDNVQNDKKVVAQTKEDLNYFVEYYVDANGDAVVVAEYEGQTVTLTEASQVVGGEEATSSTVLKAIVYDETAKSYSVTTVTGYKNFTDLSDAPGAVVLNATTGKVDTIYVYTEAAVVVPVPVIAAITVQGDYTADGYTYTVVIDGVAGTYYSKTSYAPGYYEVTVDGTALKSATPAVPDVDDAKVTFVDAGYVNTDAVGSETIDFVKNTAVYDISGKGLSLAKDVTIDVFELDADNMIIFIVG